MKERKVGYLFCVTSVGLARKFHDNFRKPIEKDSDTSYAEKHSTFFFFLIPKRTKSSQHN